jgi:hypothetical protein
MLNGFVSTESISNPRNDMDAMTEVAITGRYNIVVEGECDTFERQAPVEDFIQVLQKEGIPPEVSVVGLGNAFEDGDLVEDFATEDGP